jgi:allantoate deiminase
VREGYCEQAGIRRERPSWRSPSSDWSRQGTETMTSDGELAGSGIRSFRSADFLGDAARLTAMIDSLAAIDDAPEQDGVTRWAYTPAEREAHALVGGWLRELGLAVRTDAVGNTIAERPGRSSRPCIATGSHLDSVPNGGRFDGIAGVVAAVETARIFVENDLDHEHPIRFVAFAAEEGARFGQGCIGSKAVGGMWTPHALRSMRDANGISIAQAMDSVGFSAEDVESARWSREEWSGFIELHIEQGQVLESNNVSIGVVDSISGSTRFELVVDGRASHSGSTPMNLRADALTAASEIVLLAEAIANDPGHHGTRCTVGKLEVLPGSLTTIPGRVKLSVDVRDMDSGRQRETANEIVRRSRLVCDRRGVGVSARLLSDASPVVLPSWIRDVTVGVCKELSASYRVMCSGASHDTQMVNNAIPAGMVFVPSRGGLSHVPAEWSSSSDLALGAQVLVRSLLALDAKMSSR